MDVNGFQQLSMICSSNLKVMEHPLSLCGLTKVLLNTRHVINFANYAKRAFFVIIEYLCTIKCPGGLPLLLLKVTLSMT